MQLLVIDVDDSLLKPTDQQHRRKADQVALVSIGGHRVYDAIGSEHVAAFLTGRAFISSLVILIDTAYQVRFPFVNRLSGSQRGDQRAASD